MKSSKKGKKQDTKKLGLNTTHLSTLHQRLYHGFNLAFRYSNDKRREWYTNDVEIQRMVARSISSFLDGISPETWNMPIVKDSIPDVVKAIGGILQSPNEVVVALGSEVTVKLVKILPTLMLRPHFGHLCNSLTPLLSSRQSHVAAMSATALNIIVSNLSLNKEKEVWEILEKHDVISQVVGNLRAFCDEVKPIEYFVEMASLLSSIMQLWPPSRYPVWNDAQLMEVVEVLCNKPEATVKVAVLQFYSALALCVNGGQRLLENGNFLIQTVVQCMGESQPLSLRISAFKTARYLMATKKLCSEVLILSCEPIIKSIICALTISSMHPVKFSSQEDTLMLEACHLALITRWSGKHHNFFWRLRGDKVLAHLLVRNLQNLYPHQQSLSVEELIKVTREGLAASFLLDMRPYVWEIIGWLSAQCEEDFSPNKNDHCLRILVATACLAFVDSIGRERLLRQGDRKYTLRSISAAKATLMMLYSPCKYISSEAKLLLLEVLRSDGEEYLKQLLHALDFVYSGDMSRKPDKAQIFISLVGLTCYSGLPRFYKKVVRNGGIKTLLGFIKWWIDNVSHTEKVCLTSHLKVTSMERTCCIIDAEDWEGNEAHLILALWSLAELINSHGMEGCELDIFSRQKIYEKEQFIQDIQQISVDTTCTGLRWYCSYLLSLFGYYGFPSKLGKSIASFCEKDYGDMRLVLRDGQYLNVHQVILLIRCPSLLPGYPSDEEKMSKSNNSPARQVTEKCRTKEVTLSAQVDQEAMSKLLDFVYSGYLQAQGAIVKKLRLLAKHCNIQPLLHLLCRKRPKREVPVPRFDLTTALGPIGHEFSDIMLEAKSTEDTGRVCSCCYHSMPHIHAHRAILSSSCDYLRALFQSGMQESRSESLKVPVSWEALYKVVIWLYSYNLPKPVSGCLWANMDVQQKMLELQPYIELCWLGEFWFLDDVKEECSSLITSSLDSPTLAIKVIEVAAHFTQWELVNVAANKIAPFYRSLHSSDALDVLDEALVEIIRLASVQLAQESV